MNNKKLLMVGLGLVSVGLVSGCGPQNVCLYGAPEELAATYVDPESENPEESVEPEKSSETEFTETVPEEIESSVEENINYCLYGCPISDETKKNISEAEKYSELESIITIK